MSVCEYRWLRANFYRVPPRERAAWLRENAGALAAVRGDEL